MSNFINLDVEYFTGKLLNQSEQELLNNVNIELLVDPATHSISKVVSFAQICEKDTMVQQDQLIQKFMQDLYTDQEVQHLF